MMDSRPGTQGNDGNDEFKTGDIRIKTENDGFKTGDTRERWIQDHSRPGTQGNDGFKTDSRPETKGTMIQDRNETRNDDSRPSAIGN